MSTIIRCDRCGRDLEPRSYYVMLIEPDAAELMNRLGLQVQRMHRDFCEDCFNALRRWLQGEDNHGEDRV